MTDPVAALAKRLRLIPLACLHLGAYHSPAHENCRAVPDAPALAREALAFAREQLPTWEQIALVIEHHAHGADNAADAILRDLRARLGERG